MGSTGHMNKKQAKLSNIEKFIQTLESWVKTPRYDDLGQQRKAEIIHVLSSVVLVIGFGTLTISPFIYTNLVRGISITIGMMALILLIQILNRRGHIQISSRLFIATVWIIDIALILFSGGFNSQILSSFISIVIMGGLILGEMYTFYLAGISVIAYLLLFFLEARGLTPDVLLEFTPIALILINTVNLFLAAIVLLIVMVHKERNFRELVSKEETLEKANLELLQEIQAREKAESLLKQSESRLKSALMESPYPTMLHAENGEVLLVNTAWIENSGYSPEKLSGFGDWLDHMFRENSPQVLAIIDQLVRGDVTGADGFFDISNQNGETLKWYTRWTRLPALADGRALFLTIATDLTDLLSVESALRESEETLSIFSLVTNDGLWNWDLQTDQVTYDPRYYTMAGYEVNEFPHELEEFRKRVHPDDVERVFSQAEKHLSGEIDRYNVEFRFLRKDGSWLWVMGRGKITEQDANGNPLRFVGTHTDISAQKAVEEKLNDYQLQLEDIVEDRTQELNQRVTEVERLNVALTNILDDYQAANQRLSILRDNLSAANQELESLTYSLSTHLLKPILNIQETAKKLYKNTSKKLNKKELDAVQGIRTSAEQVNQQIDDLLRISQLSQQSLQIEETDPGKLVKKILKSYAAEIKKHKIKTIVKELPLCRGDRKLLEMVFDNLISNGIKYSAGEEHPEIQIGYQPDQDPDRVIYYIQDNGIGFDPEDEDLIFGTFRQLSYPENQPGTGIGLTLAKLIINKHGGKIWADSEKGKGATFYFDLACPRLDIE
ncbi:MAG TPA: PAS domain S-box protein [Chloroflexi bacterium]|nr:PAS domain S-box protein [Chloroflexota bacterium]